MKEAIFEMLMLQNELNTDTNGPQWRQGITKDGKVINWKRCIYMEGAELIDSFGWKHWKSIGKPPDMANIHLELVDIWHFLMSYLLAHNPIERVVEMVQEALQQRCDRTLPKEWGHEEDRHIDAYLEIFEELMALALVKSDSQPLQEELLATFVKACQSAHLDFSKLYRLYIGKNALNHFRQERGYKEGNYQKIWDGREDNQVLQEILDQNPQITYAQLLQELAKRYPTP
ncbi:MAG: dUTPase [Nitratiruptor sp.]|nr:dUTPase [Nitratiruptor sp.]NPA83294.1 dUTPase [Campylobacterota bacterium]